jgi:DNA-binding transcriptional ArsR family regulator
MASHELAAAQDQMVLLGRKSARERVVSFILMLSDSATRHGRPNDPVFLPMSRSEIADYLGLTTETVSRTFTLLKKQGLMRLARREAGSAFSDVRVTRNRRGVLNGFAAAGVASLRVCAENGFLGVAERDEHPADRAGGRVLVAA